MRTFKDKVAETLVHPEQIFRSRTDLDMELLYRHYNRTPVTEKYCCVVVKVLVDDRFIVTTYLTDAVKKGEELWKRI